MGTGRTSGAPEDAKDKEIRLGRSVKTREMKRGQQLEPDRNAARGDFDPPGGRVTAGPMHSTANDLVCYLFRSCLRPYLLGLAKFLLRMAGRGGVAALC